jgi:glycerol-3-phosphate O-acyltransferase
VFVPLYILIPLAVLAAVALIERILLPPVRVVMRRWLRGMSDERNTKLRLKLQPFKLTRKRIVEEMLIHDPEVALAARQYREANGMTWDEVTDLVRVWAREIVPRFNVYLYYRPSHWLARGLARALYRVRISFLDKRAMAAVDTDSSVIFVINHRSNFDYIIVSYIVSRLASISYAVGEWARIWPLDTLLRRMGAYFVRRKASDPLYRKVLERFVQLSAESGVTQGIFPEGRLTRDGRLGPPKLGLLSYLLKRFDPAAPRDLVFVPVGINYDRVLEDRTHAGETAGTLPKASSGAAVRTALGAVGKLVLLVVRGRFHRFGLACVNFGVPLSVKGYINALGKDFRRMGEDEYRAEVQRLGERLMGEIARAVPVTPVALVAHAFLAAGGTSVLHEELLAAVEERLAALSRRGVAIALPRTPAADLVALGLRSLRLRRVVHEADGVLSIDAADAPLLQYHANSIAHHLEPAPRPSTK